MKSEMSNRPTYNKERNIKSSDNITKQTSINKRVLYSCNVQVGNEYVTHPEEILTLLTILLLELAKTFGFTDKDIYSGPFSSKITFAPTSIVVFLKRQCVSCGFPHGTVSIPHL